MSQPSPFLWGTLFAGAGAPGDAGSCVISGGADVWYPYNGTYVSQFTGGQIGVLLQRLLPGQSGPIQVNGILDRSILNLGSGAAGAVIAAPRPARGVGLSIGTCDSSGQVTISPSYAGSTSVGTLGGYTLPTAAPLAGQAAVFDGAQWGYATAASASGGTTTATAFTPPALGASTTLDVKDATVLAKDQDATFAGTLTYLVTNIAGNTVTIFNRSQLNAVGGTVAIGAVVAFGGSGTSQAAATLLSGTVQAIDAVTLKATPQGHDQVEIILSYAAQGADPTGTLTTNAPAIEAMLATMSTTGRRGVMPKGIYKTQRPIFWPYSGIELTGPRIYDVSDANRAVIQTVGPPGASGATTFPAIIMGNQADPVFSLAGASPSGTAMIPYGFPSSAVESSQLNVSSFEGASLNGWGKFAFSHIFKPNTAASSFQVYVIAGSKGTKYAGGASTSAFTLYRSNTSGFDQLVVQFTTSVTGSVTKFSTVHLTMGTEYLVTVTYDGSFLRTFINGVEDTAIRAAMTGTIVQQPCERFVVGDQHDQVYFYGSTSAANTIYGLDPGGYFGPFRISFGGAHVYTANFTPAYPLAEDVSGTTVTTPGGNTSLCTGLLVDFAVGKRTSTLYPGNGNWVIAISNVTRTSQAPRTLGSTVWLSLYGRLTNYLTNNKIKSIVLNSIGIGLHASAADFLELTDVQLQGTMGGALLDCFSYFAEVYRGFSRTTLSSQTVFTTPAKLVFDAIGYCCASEGISLFHARAEGGTWQAVMSGGTMTRPYFDVAGDGCVFVAGGFRTFVAHDVHLYSEGPDANIALLYLSGCFAADVSGLIGTIYGAVPACVVVAGGSNGIALRAMNFGPIAAALAFDSPPDGPVSVSGQLGLGAIASKTVTWLDPARKGPIVFPCEIDGVFAVATTADANRTLNDPEFFAGKTFKFSDAFWTTNRNLVFPFVLEGKEKIVWNTSGTRTLTITPGSVTVAPGASARVVGRGAAYVAAP